MDPMTNRLTIARSARADPVFEEVKRTGDLQADTPRSMRGRLGTYLGSIDPITAAQWSKECGSAIGTKEFALYAKRKLMSGDWSHFRAERVRGLYGVK